MMFRTPKTRQRYGDGWLDHTLSTAGHHIQGVIAGGMLAFGDWRLAAIAITWAALYVAYQGLSVIRKKDSAGLDTSDFMVGMAVTLAIAGLWHGWELLR